MVKTLIKLGLLLVVGILIYNFVFGNQEEKEQSKEVFKKTGSVLSSTWDLLKSERNKFDAGKYDQALDKLGGAYRAIREQAEHIDKKVLNRLDDLEKRKAQLEKELDGIETEDAALVPAPAPKKGVAKVPEQQSSQNTDQQRRKEQLMRELDKLMSDTDQLLKQAQQ